MPALRWRSTRDIKRSGSTLDPVYELPTQIEAVGVLSHFISRSGLMRTYKTQDISNQVHSEEGSRVRTC